MTPSDLWRRRLGLVLIGGAALMTILGLTLLAGRLEGRRFLAFWAACWLLALLALVTAVVDMAVMSARGREERRQLAKDIAADIAAASREGQADTTTGSTAERP